MVYNNPVDYGIEVTVDMMAELTEHDNIQAIKESTRDTSNITRMINRFGDRISVFSGVDTIACESLMLGASGWVAGLVCAFPRETVAIYNLVKANRIEEALKINRWFMPLLELDINSKLVQNIKLAEVATGIGTEPVRKPRLKLTGQERENVLSVINTAMNNRNGIEELIQNHSEFSRQA
jgi:4-hydroxy-tetrahydrodipicolinate synthase